MDLQKAKIYLDKINREFARMTKDPDNVTRLDVDITLAHIREFYDAFFSEPEAVAPVAPPPKVEHTPRKAAAVPPPAPVVVETPAPPPPPPVVIETPAPPPPPPVVIETPAPPPPPPVVIETPAPPPPAPKPSAPAAPGEIEALFEYKEAKELSEKLAEAPIPDLKRAIALNDRLLLTRELFGGDSAAFDAALVAVNNANGFEAAKAYLINECIHRYGWADKSRIEVAKNFIKLVRRRYK